MPTSEYCIVLSDLPLEAMAALVEHDHLPDIVAAELKPPGLVGLEDGCRGLRRDPAG